MLMDSPVSNICRVQTIVLFPSNFFIRAFSYVSLVHFRVKKNGKFEAAKTGSSYGFLPVEITSSALSSM